MNKIIHELGSRFFICVDTVRSTHRLPGDKKYIYLHEWRQNSWLSCRRLFQSHGASEYVFGCFLTTTYNLYLCQIVNVIYSMQKCLLTLKLFNVYHLRCFSVGSNVFISFQGVFCHLVARQSTCAHLFGSVIG